MRNWKARFGFYITMRRVPLLLIGSLAVLAQAPREDPLDQAIKAAWQARNEGRFDNAAAAREQARSLLQRVPAASPQFSNWVRQVAQLYEASASNAEARVVLQDGLARTASLGDSHPARIELLNELGNLCQQDGNLLKAVAYLERAAAAQAATPPAAGQPIIGVFISGNPRYFGGNFGNSIGAYTRLADLYRQLGRPDAVAAIAIKIRALASSDQTALAQFYEQDGQVEQAAAIYRAEADQSVDPQARSFALQSLAGIQARQERYADAVTTFQQAIAAVQSSDDSNVRSQTTWMQQTLASYMRQAGQIEQADQVYRQLLQQNLDGPQYSQSLGMYAQYLADTECSAQGESLLKNYLAATPNLDSQQQANLLFSLANLASRKGDSTSADEYQRAGEALQPQPLAEQVTIRNVVSSARTALREKRWDDAYGLSLDALATAAHAADGQQIAWFIPEVAFALAANKEPAKAEQLYQRLLAVAQNWARENMQPLITVTEHYARFLTGQSDRLNELPAAIEQYRSLLIEANGPESGTLVQPLRMKIEFERSNPQPEKAAASARDLLELQESLSGNTSQPYLDDLRLVAGVYEGAGASARALPLYRNAVTIADLLALPHMPGTDWRRSQTRMDLAFALARAGEFDEAETLGEEAVALQRSPSTPNPPIAQQLEQIRQMKRAAAASASRVADQ
jgi:Flp pilus assembly protein TadD